MIRFELERVSGLRRRAQRATCGARKPPKGWSRSDTDPMDLLAVFEPLRNRDGFVLRAYRLALGGDGHGVVWALPEHAPFPDPAECPPPTGQTRTHLLATPRPEGALDDFMEAIEGDHSPWSYLCASLFEREARELGARWHGLDWTDHTLLGMDPWEQADRFPGPEHAFSPTPREGWEWLLPEPADWRPAVRADASAVEVSFFTYNARGRETILRHTDRYQAGGYVLQHERDTLARGARGFTY